nr:phosphonate metabolism transcriptional regulator PhnF [Desulfobulbaceae bacterium]
MNKIDKSNGNIPVYRQVSSVLNSEIREIYSTGAALPPEKELASRFKINRQTLRRAVDELENDGLVNRIRGKGTFVVGAVVDYDIKSTTRFTENLESQGRRANSSVLRQIGIPASEEVAEKLGVKENTPVIYIETLRKVDGLPFCIVSHFFSYIEFHSLLKKYKEGSLHDFIYQHYNINLRRALTLVTAVIPQSDDAELLQINKNTPILRVKSLNINSSTGEPVEYVVTRFRGDAAQLSIES